MSAGASNDVTSFRWEIVDLKKQCDEFEDRNEIMFSDTFPLISQPHIRFELCIDSAYTLFQEGSIGIEFSEFDDDYHENHYPDDGIDYNDFVKIDIKLWIESTDGQKFGKSSMLACEFNGVGDCHLFKFIPGTCYDLFYELYNKHKNFFICCELSNLRTRTPALELLQNYQQNNWILYEQGIYDAVIKVEDKEYKVLKAFFMAQSEIFKHMFLSKFKEGTTSRINVNDVKKETMEHLIKWIYTGQIEDQAHIDDLFVAADKYDIKLLKKMCLGIMMDSTNEQNVFLRLTLAAMHNENRLKQVALSVIDVMSKEGFSEFTMSQEWVELNRKHPNIADEIITWIREKVNA